MWIPYGETSANGQTSKKCASNCFLTRWIVRFSIFYLIYAALFRCSSTPFSFSYNPNHELLVCREMASMQEHVSPVLHEYAGKTHALLEPYAGKYMNAAHDAWKKTSPVLHKMAKQAHSLYRTNVEPGARALYKQLHQWSLPHQRTVHNHYKKHVHPHVKKMGRILDPYVRTYHKDVHPHVLKGLDQLFDAHEKSSKFYVDKLHPRIKQNLYNAYAYVRHTLFPFAHHHYVKHAHPHVKKLHDLVSATVANALHKYGISDGSLTNKITESVQETYHQAIDTVDDQLSKSGLKDGSVVNKVQEAAKKAYEKVDDAVDSTMKEHGIRDKTVTDGIKEAYQHGKEAVRM